MLENNIRLNLSDYWLNRKYSHDVESSTNAKFQFSKQLALLLFIAMGLTSIGNVGTVIAWCGVIIWSFKGAAEAIEGLLIAFVLGSLNPELFYHHPQESSFRLFVFVVAIIRVGVVWYQLRFPHPSWLKFICLFFIFGFLSAMNSYFPSISLFKLISFFLGSLAIFIGIWVKHTIDWESKIITFGAILTIFSLPLILTSQGYARNEIGFQGIFSQPQLYGITIAPVISLAIAALLFERKIRVHYILLIGSMFVVLYLSKCRTAFLALILGAIISTLVAPKIRSLYKKLFFNPWFYCLLFGVLFAVLNYSEAVTSFLLKNSDINEREGTLVVEEGRGIFSSREDLANQSWESFTSNMIIGTGFGLPFNHDDAVPIIDPIFSIPISLGVEKGVIVTAVLEECGILGAGTLLILLFWQFKSLSRASLLAPILIFTVALMVNFGELVYFSFGGAGAFIHICMAYGLACVIPLPTRNES